MSFEMKYDRDGNPIKQPIEAVSIPEETPQETELSSQEHQSIMDTVEVDQAEQSNEEEVQQEKEKVNNSFSKNAKPTTAENFRQLREAKEREERDRQRAERERDDYARRVKELEEKYRQPQKAADPEEDLNIQINPDDLVEGKHLSKVDKKIKYLENKLEQYERKTTQQTIQNQLRAQFPDFDRVVSQDHLNRLQETEPELYSTLNASNDLYSTAVSAYKMIKKLGIAQTEEVKADIQRVQKNAVKPRSLSGISPQMGDSPLSRANAFANGLTEDLKSQLYKEMVAASKNM